MKTRATTDVAGTWADHAAIQKPNASGSQTNELAIQVGEGLLDHPGLPVPGLNQGIDPGLAGRDQRKLGSDKKGIRRQEDNDGEDTKPVGSAGGLLHGG